MLSLTASLLAFAPAPGAGPVHRPPSDVELDVRVEVVSAETLASLGDRLSLEGLVSTLPRPVAAAGPPLRARLDTLLEPRTLGRGTVVDDVDFSLVERIEVLRGPAGTLYGTDAVSGVVNLIRRGPGQSSGYEELTVELVSSYPASNGDASFEAVRRATCTAQLPIGGALLYTGFADDSTRAWTANVPGLSDSGPLGNYFASDAFRSGASDLYLVLSGVDGATDGALDARFCALTPLDLAGLELGPATGVVVPGVVLGAGDLTGWFAGRGTGGVLGELTAVTADGAPTQLVFGEGYRIGLDLRPKVQVDGSITLNFDTRAWLPEAARGSVLDTERSTTGVALLRPGETLALEGLVNERTLESGAASSLVDLPVLGGLFQGDAAARADRRLLVFITPQLVRQDEDGRALTSAGAIPDNQLLAPGPNQLYFEGYVGAVRQGYPGFEWLRSESGGSIAQRPLAKFDDYASGSEVGLSMAKGIGWSLYGGRDSQVVIDARFLDTDTSSREDLISAGGLGLGIEDPNGGGFFITPGNGDVTDVLFDLAYSAFWLGLGVEEGFDICSDCWLAVTTSLRYEGSDYEAAMSGVTNSGTLDILREDDIDSWLLGPTLEGTFSHDFGCVKGYCAADLMLGYGTADATTRVLVGTFPERARDLEESQLVWELGLRAGLRRERGDLSLGLEVGAHYGNRYPVVEYQEFDPAQLEYEADWRTHLGLNVGYRF